MKTCKIFLVLFVLIATVGIASAATGDTPVTTKLTVNGNDIHIIKFYDSECDTFNYVIFNDNSMSISTIHMDDLEIDDERKEILKSKYNMYNYNIMFET